MAILNLNAIIVFASALSALAVAVAWKFSLGSAVPYGCFTVYVLFMIRIRHGFGDPAVVSLFVFLLYAVLPALVHADAPPTSDFGFDLQGAAYIYAVASVAIISATGVAFSLLPCRDTTGDVARKGSFLTEAIVAGGLSVVLSAIFIVKNGMFDISDPDSYLSRFADLGRPGTGILLLSAPLAAASLCFTAVSLNRVQPIFLIPVIPYLSLFAALGQRKYLLIPFLFLVFRYLRTRSVLHLLLVLTLAISGYVVFNYIGFLRAETIGLGEALDAQTIALFGGNAAAYMNEEVYTLYVTAASAYGQAIDASFAENYLGAIRFLLPHMLFGQQYVPTETRFAQLVAPDDADLNGGLGFSFFGEAYLVNGPIGIFLATLAITLALRGIFVSGGGLRFRGLWGAVSLSCTYYAMWYLRISFALLLREVIIQIGVILCIHAAARLVHWRGGLLVTHPTAWPAR